MQTPAGSPLPTGVENCLCLEQTRGAAVGAATTDCPNVGGWGCIDASLSASRGDGRSTSVRRIGRKLEGTVIGQAIVDLTVNLGNDFDRNLRARLQIMLLGWRAGP